MESKRDVSLTLNMTMDIFVYAISCHCEQATRARQSTGKEAQHTQLSHKIYTTLNFTMMQ